MDIRIKTTDYQMTDETARYIDTRIASIVKALPPQEAEHARCEVELGRLTGEHHRNGAVWFAELNIALKGKSLRATAQRESITEAIDEVKDDILRQIRKHHQFHRRIARKGGAIIKTALRFGRSA